MWRTTWIKKSSDLITTWFFTSWKEPWKQTWHSKSQLISTNRSNSNDLELVSVAGNGQQLRLLLDPILERLVQLACHDRWRLVWSLWREKKTYETASNGIKLIQIASWYQAFRMYSNWKLMPYTTLTSRSIRMRTCCYPKATLSNAFIWM